MNKTVFDYIAPWADVINIVCPDINDEADQLADLLDSKDIPFEYCTVHDGSVYNGETGLALLGLNGVDCILEGETALEGYFYSVDEAKALIEAQEYSHLVVNGVDYVQVSDYFQKMALMYDFDAFCRSEYENEPSSKNAEGFPNDDDNETEVLSDKDLNPSSNPFSNKTQLMDAAQQSVYRVYEMYNQAINILFEKDENYAK